MPDTLPPVLEDAAKQRIFAEERFRADIAGTLKSLGAPRQSAFAHFFGSDNFRWIAVTLVIPFTVWVWGTYSDSIAKREAETREKAAQTEAKSREDTLRKDAESKLRLETVQRNVELVSTLLPYLADADANKQDLAMAIVGQMRLEANFPQTLEVAFRAIIERRQQRATAPQATPSDLRELEKAARFAEPSPLKGGGPPTKVAGLPTISLPPRVYIAFFLDQDSAQAGKLQEFFRSRKLLVPAVQRMSRDTAISPGQPPTSNELRLFYFSQEDQSLAESIGSDMMKAGFPLSKEGIRLVNVERVTSTRQRFEVWFPNPPSERRPG